MTLASPRAVDGLWAASLLLWAALGLWSHPDPTPARLAVAALHLTVAGLLLVRRPARAALSVGSAAGALPALAVVPLVLLAAPTPLAWAHELGGLFLVGAAIAIASFLCLGRAFGVLPAHRDVVDRGPYRWIRHPAYLGEGLMVAATCATIGGWRGSLLGTVAAGAFVLRIHAEESVLARSRRYRAYRRRVAWRLVPRVW